MINKILSTIIVMCGLTFSLSAQLYYDVKRPENDFKLWEIVSITDEHTILMQSNQLYIWNHKSKKMTVDIELDAYHPRHAQLLEDNSIAIFDRQGYLIKVNLEGEQIERRLLTKIGGILHFSADGNILYSFSQWGLRVYDLRNNKCKRIYKNKKNEEFLSLIFPSEFRRTNENKYGTHFCKKSNSVLTGLESTFRIMKYSDSGVKLVKETNPNLLKGKIISYRLNDAEDKITCVTRKQFEYGSSTINDSLFFYDLSFPELEIQNEYPSAYNIGDPFYGKGFLFLDKEKSILFYTNDSTFVIRHLDDGKMTYHTSSQSYPIVGMSKLNVLAQNDNYAISSITLKKPYLFLSKVGNEGIKVEPVDETPINPYGYNVSYRPYGFLTYFEIDQTATCIGDPNVSKNWSSTEQPHPPHITWDALFVFDVFENNKLTQYIPMEMDSVGIVESDGNKVFKYKIKFISNDQLSAICWMYVRINDPKKRQFIITDILDPEHINNTAMSRRYSTEGYYD